MLRITKTTLLCCIVLCGAAHAGPITTFDFSTDESGAPIANGQQIDTEFSSVFTVSGSGINNVGISAIDTTPGGPASTEAINTDMMVNLGNAIISQYRSRATQTVPGFFDFATDNAVGGTIIFDFTAPTQPTSITLIDIDDNAGANVRLYDVMGNVRTYAVPDEWTGDRRNGPLGYGDLDLTSLADQAGHLPAILATASEDAGFKPGSVARLEIQLIGSGGVDNLAIMMVPEPSSVIGIFWCVIAAIRFVRQPNR